jgi:hypothetical protein
MASLLSLTKQVSLGVLPACSFASAVPNRIQFWLNIDFALGKKKHSRDNFREGCSAGQNLPVGAVLAGLRSANSSAVRRPGRAKAGKTMVHTGTENYEQM